MEQSERCFRERNDAGAQNAPMLVQKKGSISDEVWLHFFNQYLFEHGLISGTERNKMAVKINCMSGNICRK